MPSMDTTYMMPPTSSHEQVQSSAYYASDPPQQTPQGHLTSHPSEMQSFYGPVHSYISGPQQQQQQHCMLDQHPIYTVQPMVNMHQMTAATAFRGIMHMTPIASPQPSNLKPAIFVQQGSPALMPLDARFAAHEFYGFPSTPPLSIAGSSISSPPSTNDPLHTPINEGLFSFGGVEGIREEHENVAQPESLAHLDISRTDSPPMTPAFIHPHSLIAGQNPEFLSAGSSCPSLSPSPSPVPSEFTLSQSGLQVDLSSTHFCDPRQLTVEPSESSNDSDLPALPTLSCTEEEPKVVVGSDAVTLPVHENSPPSFTGFTCAEDPLDSLPTFDSFADLDSEDEFVTRLVDFPSGNTLYVEEKRQCADQYLASEEEYLSDHDQEESPERCFALSALPYMEKSSAWLQSESEESSDELKIKKRSGSRRSCRRQGFAEGSPERKVQDLSNKTNSQALHVANSLHNSPPRLNSDASVLSNACDGSDAHVSVNRRGRKQSLTDDPSKTFVCTLCSRRFRRQEHLKRHYRSLHTSDKPFECNECGKRFSRSDNLAQHARTHSSGIVLMAAINAHGSITQPSYTGDNLKTVPYETGSVTAGKTASETLGSGQGDRRVAKKRKRN